MPVWKGQIVSKARWLELRSGAAAEAVIPPKAPAKLRAKVSIRGRQSDVPKARRGPVVKLPKPPAMTTEAVAVHTADDEAFRQEVTAPQASMAEMVARQSGAIEAEEDA